MESSYHSQKSTESSSISQKNMESSSFSPLTREYSINDLIHEEQIDKDLICAICSDIVYNPKECQKCEHLFCHSCISDWQKKKNECPFNCKGELVLQNVHRFVKNAIANLQLKCQFCQQTYVFQNKNIHLDQCTERILKCTNIGCNYEGKRKAIDLHKDQCDYRKQNNCKRCTALEIQLLEAQNKLLGLRKEVDMTQSKILPKTMNNLCPKRKHEMVQFDPGWDLQGIEPLKLDCAVCKEKAHCRFRCPGCDINICLKCKPLTFSRIYCTNMHKLTLKSYTNMGQASCDMCCRNNIIVSMGCRICNLDLCEQCYNNLPLE